MKVHLTILTKSHDPLSGRPPAWSPLRPILQQESGPGPASNAILPFKTPQNNSRTVPSKNGPKAQNP